MIVIRLQLPSLESSSKALLGFSWLLVAGPHSSSQSSLTVFSANNNKMSTDLFASPSGQHLQPMDHWFWPTSSLLSPLMDSNKSQSVNSSVSSVTTTVSTTSGTYHRRHKHWWKVCWIYNNGHFIANPSKGSNLKQFQQQFSSFSMCSSNMSAIFNDRCVKRDE